jgi:hypothetical protein
MLRRISTSLFVVLAFLASQNALHASEARLVTILYDEADKLTVIIEGQEPIPSPRSYQFLLEKTDRVTLQLRAIGAFTSLRIDYTITGTDVNARFRDVAQKIFSPQQAIAESTRVQEETKAVNDDLLPGGRITVTFKRVSTDGTEESKDVQFRIKDEDPWFFPSAGLAFSTAKETEVAIVKTSNIVTVTIDGEERQVNEQQILLRNGDDSGLRPIQALISFLNFQIFKRFYGSLGFQLNGQIFQEPLLGGTYYFRHGPVGFAFTAGVHFSKEVEIVESSGFKSGQTVDPGINLTVDDIPIQERYKSRFFLAFSASF